MHSQSVTAAGKRRARLDEEPDSRAKMIAKAKELSGTQVAFTVVTSQF
jgi:hypothetical protein